MILELHNYDYNALCQVHGNIREFARKSYGLECREILQRDGFVILCLGSPPAPGGGPIQGSTNIERTLAQINQRLDNLNQMAGDIMSTVQEALDAVTAQSGKVDSLITLVQELHDAATKIPPAGLTPEQQSGIDKIVEMSNLESTKVQAAIDANPLPAPAPEPAPTPDPAPVSSGDDTAASGSDAPVSQ